MTLSARLASLEKALRAGLSRAGGCAVCRDWPAYRSGYSKDDPWAPFGRCPVCGRAPEMVCAPTEAEAAALAAQCGPGTKVYVGLDVGAI